MSIIDKKADDFLTYKYEIHELFLLFSDGAHQLPSERVNGLTVMDHFLENLYPVLKLDIALEENLYNKIIKDKANLKVKICVRQYYRINTESENSMKSNFLNEVFSLILDDSNNTIAQKAHNLEYPEGDTNEMNAVTTTMELFLYKKDLIKDNTDAISGTFKNCTISGVLGWALSKLGVTKVLCPRPDNQEVYEELCIPPMAIAEVLAFIDSFYGIYDTGTIMYFGLQRGYILPFCKQANVFEGGEADTVCILVPSIASEMTDQICSLKKYSDAKPYLLADPASFAPANRDVSGEILDAENIEIIDVGEGSVDNEKEKNRKTVVIPSKNKFYRKIYESTAKSNESVISIAFKDGDYSVLTPNKRYQFIFEDTKMTQEYKGIYYLTQLDITFVKEAEELTGGAQGVFRRGVE